MRGVRFVIKTEVITRPTKQDLCTQIATRLNLSAPKESRGSSIDASFLDEINQALFGVPTNQSSAPRRLEVLMNNLGLVYDPYWDSSERRPSKGGSTITARGYSRVAAAITGNPRCFVLRVSDGEKGQRWEKDHTRQFRYDRSVSGRKALNDAGPGSYVVFYTTSKARENQRKFVGVAKVEYIEGDYEALEWTARLSEFGEFARPIDYQEIRISGHNTQHAIAEIPYATLLEITTLGDPKNDFEFMGSSYSMLEDFENNLPDVSESHLLQREFSDVNIDDLDIYFRMPDVRPMEAEFYPKIQEALYVEAESSTLRLSNQARPQRKSDWLTNRKIEQQAVAIVRKALSKDGWQEVKDEQKNGVGYDLEFRRNQAILHLEVKGTRAHTIGFNLTPKEWWRLRTDPCWIVLLVTGVGGKNPSIHYLDRQTLSGATFMVSGYSVNL